MTRDELYHALNDAISRPGWDTIKLMEHIDSYVATERHQIEQQIGEHTGYRLQAERERIAQAIEALTPGWITRSEAARIARAES